MFQSAIHGQHEESEKLSSGSNKMSLDVDDQILAALQPKAEESVTMWHECKITVTELL